MRKYIALALTAACAASLASCTDKAADESSAEKTSHDTVEEKYDALNGRTSVLEELEDEFQELPYFADAYRRLTEEEYFEILHENAAIVGLYCDGFDDAFDNADAIDMEHFLNSWKDSEGCPLINQFAPELCYQICGSGLTYYHFKIEGGYVLTFDINGVFHSLSCMRDGKVIEYDLKKTIYDFLEKYSENA